MEQLPPSSTKVATKWALIYLVTGIILTYLFKFLNVDLNSPVKYIIYVPFIAYLLLGIKEYKEQLGGYIKFGEAFSTGFRFGLFAGLLYAVFMFLYLKFLDPSAMTQILDAQKEAGAAKGATPEQIEQGIEFMQKFGAALVAFGTAVWFAILGVILGLIGAAIFKKERSPFDVDEATIEPQA